ncbi:hypothetical protein DEO72_LG8g1297 [Vigna unguiculata]|uniref:Uncharacterized protein n=1 Tax=Vigna unguiculata TaxID=3917 RepID=A0A4D6MPH4_VIGUN|nr:hypothetical protein DEO72_LG8g1297 [Vigna unguiculata]
MAKKRNPHFLVDHENFAHLLPSIKLMIIARRTVTYNTTIQTNGYTDGAPPWTPTNRGHGITSRPLKRSPGGLT